ncbi:MAG TPA: phosphoadenosine phosphosulfate reductase family protein [Burkholderiales bacterium]|nr:phosphoadenosine phosphosulfate reductase family protein [Burkholderiales bacterium]
MSLQDAVADVLARHEKVALQFSGGKDSMACLFLLRPWLDRITVYWTNTGDPIPETVEVIEACKAWIPRFEEIRSDAPAWWEQNGHPSDLVPTYSTPLGRVMGFSGLKVSDRFTCCAANVMIPMFNRMKADRITCIIRGQKLCDMPTVPLRSGDVSDGFEVFYPIEQWSHEDVLAYLKAEGAPLHPCYSEGTTGVDCAHCTAWWDESHIAFIRERHPEAHRTVIRHIRLVTAEIAKHARHLDAILTKEGG